jgi:hypothetical protein
MKRKAWAIFAVFALFLAGCTAQQWFKLVEALLPLAAQIATQFYTYSNNGTLTPADAANIQKFSTDAQTILTDIGNDVTAWQTTADPSKLAHINALLAQLKTQANDLTSILQVKNPNTLAFINGIVADAIDLAGLIPIIETSPPAVTASRRTITVVRMRTSLPKAKSLEDVFKARLASLPK